MEKYTLVGKTALDQTARINAEVVKFTGHNDYFHVTLSEDGKSVTVITGKGCYYIRKHPTLNVFTGYCNGVRTEITLKKIVGELRFWKK